MYDKGFEFLSTFVFLHFSLLDYFCINAVPIANCAAPARAFYWSTQLHEAWLLQHRGQPHFPSRFGLGWPQMAGHGGKGHAKSMDQAAAAHEDDDGTSWELRRVNGGHSGIGGPWILRRMNRCDFSPAFLALSHGARATMVDPMGCRMLISPLIILSAISSSPTMTSTAQLIMRPEASARGPVAFVHTHYLLRL